MDAIPIKLSLIGDTVFCFNADDYMTIRVQHRIIGRLVGSTVKWPRNTVLHGLPAIFSPYETQLLIDKGVVQLCKKAFSDTLDERMEKQYVEHCQEQLLELHEIGQEKRVDDAKNNMDKILAGKRKKAIKSGRDPNEITVDAILEEVKNRPVGNDAGILVQVPTQEPFDIDYEEIKTAPKLDPLKYQVFCDLWEKGNSITFGETFGGDFLVYPGEPLHFHASHIIHVLSDEEAKTMTSRTFTTRTRLSVNVNKLCTFVFQNQETKKLCYQTVQWMGK